MRIRPLMCLLLAALSALSLTLIDVDVQVADCTLFFVRDTLLSAQGGALTAALLWGLLVAFYRKWLFAPHAWKRFEKAKTVLLAGFFACVLSLSAAYKQGDAALENFTAYTHLMLLLAKACGYLPLLYTALKLLLKWLSRPMRLTASVDPRRVFWLSFAAMLLCWGVSWLARYPGAITSDASRVLQHYYGEAVTTADHPYAYTLLLGLFTQVGLWLHQGNLGVALFCCFQMAFLAAMLALTLRDMARAGWRPGVLIGVGCLYCFVPLYSIYASAIIKDSLYSAVFVGYMLVLWRAFDNPRSAAQRPGWWAGLIASSALLLLLRHNGKMLVWPMSVVLAVLLFRRAGIGRRVWKLLLIAVPVVVVGLFNALIVPLKALSVDSTPDVLGVLIQQTGRILRDHGEDVSESELASIDRLLHLDQLEYEPSLSDSLRKEYRYFEDITLEDKLSFAGTALSLGLRHPLTAFHSFWLLNGGYLDPLSDGTTYYARMTPASSDKYCRTLGAEQPAWSVALGERILEVETIWRSLPPIRLLCSIGVYVWGLLLLFFLLGRMDRRAWRWLLLPMLMTLVASLLSPGYAACTRYAFPIVYALPYAALMLGGRLLGRAG